MVESISSCFYYMPRNLVLREMFKYFCFLIFLFISCFTSHLHACSNVERDSLLSFSLDLTTTDSPPLDWTSSKDCCSWEGVQCNNNKTRVIRLSLPERGLTGRIPPFLGNLTQLSCLNLSRNYLSGPLPVEIFSLHLLETLDLRNNRLTGALPPSLPFRFIEKLDISSNNFYGSIASSFFQLSERLTSLNVSNNNITGHLSSSICASVPRSSVQLLDFSNNGFTGNIPLGFGKCSSLRVLLAGFNSITGPIPSDIYNATSLQVLGLHVNYLSGPISPRISHLENLEYLELRDNFLNGSIPENIGRLSRLQSLLLQSNDLTGNLPPSLTNCTNLTSLILRVNHLGGDISSFDFSKFPSLRLIDLGNNYFTGVIPPSIYSCKLLQAIRLCGNNLEGQISSDILGLESLTYVSLSNNRLTNITGAIRLLSGCKNITTILICGNFLNETLPDDELLINPDGFKDLHSLALCGCNLHGKIPTWFEKLKKLKFLDISNNKLTGTIPGWLGNLLELFYLNLCGNSLSGAIPEGLFDMQGLDLGQPVLELPVFLMPYCVVDRQYNTLGNIKPSVILARNRLTGKIPTEIGNLKFLHILDLSRNNLYGDIPDEISYLTDLETLDVSGNNLTGTIPGSLVRLNFLSQFNVANNNLTGRVPSDGQFHTFPPASFEGNPGLCGSVMHRKCSTGKPRADRHDQDDTFTIWESSELHFGIIAGVVFGFLVGSTIGILFLSPSVKFKFLGLNVQNKNTRTKKKRKIHPGGGSW